MNRRNRTEKRLRELEAECGAEGRRLAEIRGEEPPDDRFDEMFGLWMETERTPSELWARAGDVLMTSGLIVIFILVIVGVILAL